MGSVVETSWSSTRTRPLVGRTRALTVRRRGVLPEPLRPSKAVVLPGAMRRVMSWRSWRFPATVTLRDWNSTPWEDIGALRCALGRAEIPSAAEARTYLRSKGKSKGKRRSRSLRDDNQKGKSNDKSNYRGLRCAQDDGEKRAAAVGAKA